MDLTPIKTKLENYLDAQGHPRSYIDFQTKTLFDQDSFKDRIEAFLAMGQPTNKSSRVLVSGCSVGEELQTLLNFGFDNLVGTEISDIYVEICKQRFSGNATIEKVTDELMPFESDSIGGIYSAHIIEHTKNPRLYVMECLRLLEPGGVLYLEFPTRYNLVELHTGTVSFEWLPIPLRNFMLFLASNVAPSKKNRIHYRSVRQTLRPISVGMILRFAREMVNQVRVEGRQRIGGIDRITLRVVRKT